MSTTKQHTRKLVQLSILLALTIVLQMVGNNIKIGPVSISLVLIPIVLGGVLQGPLAGGFLGLAFGLITLGEPMAQSLLPLSPVMTVVICVGKGALAGMGAGFFYKLIAKKNQTVALFTAAAAAPVINTLFFVGGCTVIADTIISAGTFGAIPAETPRWMFFLMIFAGVALNFIAELAVNLLVAPALHRVTETIEKRLKK